MTARGLAVSFWRLGRVTNQSDEQINVVSNFPGGDSSSALIAACEIFINAGAQSFDQRSARQKLFPAFNTSAHQVDLSLAWDLDFWGKYRRANESARATLLATQWAREAVISTLVSDVAAAYFQLRELDLQLEISRRTLVSRRESLTDASAGKWRRYVYA